MRPKERGSTMEYENHYASNGKANTGVALGASALGVSLLNGGLGSILGGGWNANQSGDSAFINRYEAGMQAKISELETEVKLRDANTYTLGEVGKLRDYMERRLDRVEHEICDQKVFNATQIGTISCIQGQIAQLYGLTKLVVPNSAICPGWGNVTVTPEAAAAAAG